MSEFLSENEMVVGIKGTTAAAALKRILTGISGDKSVFNVGGYGVRFQLDIAYVVSDVDVKLDQDKIRFDDLLIDTNFNFRIDLNFNDMYDSIPIPKPPRCVTACIPFTKKCVKKCFNFGSSRISVSIPISFNTAGLYSPGVDASPDEFKIYPRLISFTPFVIDPAETFGRICAAIASRLPWPLNQIGGALCRDFTRIFEFFVRELISAVNDIVEFFFDESHGWLGLKLRFLNLLSLDRHRFPGTGTGANNPRVPVFLSACEVKVNSASELEARVIVIPT